MEKSWSHFARDTDEPGSFPAAESGLMAGKDQDEVLEDASADDLQDIPREDRKLIFQNLKRGFILPPDTVVWNTLSVP